jgi:hypothetical protein
LTIPFYRWGFTVNLAVGEFCIRTRKRYYMPAFAVQVHLYGYRIPRRTSTLPAWRLRNRWAFIQFGDKTCWLRRY